VNSLLVALLVLSLIVMLGTYLWTFVESYRSDAVLTLWSVICCFPIFLVLWRHWRRLLLPTLLSIAATAALTLCSLALGVLRDVQWAEEVARGTAYPTQLDSNE